MERNETFERIVDKVRRNKYLANQVRLGLRFQLRALRKERNLTQTELAELIGSKQAVISRIENRNADRVSIPTLLRIAEALDVGVTIRFDRIDEVVSWYGNLTPEKLAPKSSEQIIEDVKKGVTRKKPTKTVRREIKTNTHSVQLTLFQESLPSGGARVLPFRMPLTAPNVLRTVSTPNTESTRTAA